MFDPMKIFQDLWANPQAIEQLAQKAAMQGDPTQFMQGMQQAKAAMPEWDQAVASQGFQNPQGPQGVQQALAQNPMAGIMQQPMPPGPSLGQAIGAQPNVQALPGVQQPLGQPSPITHGFGAIDTDLDAFGGPGPANPYLPEGHPNLGSILSGEQKPTPEQDQDQDKDKWARAAKAWEMLQAGRQPPPEAPRGGGPALGAAALAGTPVPDLYQAQAQPGTGAALVAALLGRRF